MLSNCLVLENWFYSYNKGIYILKHLNTSPRYQGVHNTLVFNRFVHISNSFEDLLSCTPSGGESSVSTSKQLSITKFLHHIIRSWNYLLSTKNFKIAAIKKNIKQQLYI